MQSFMSVDQARASVRLLERIATVHHSVKTVTDLAICYFILGDSPAALNLAKIAFEKDPNNARVVGNLALIAKDLGHFLAAYQSFKMAYEDLKSDDHLIALGYAESLLVRGRWLDAWPIYENARDSREDSVIAAGIPDIVKPWNGKSKVMELLLIDEGGLGDSIAYSRWLPVLTEKGVNWKYLPWDIMRGFYERASWCGPERLLSIGQKPRSSHWTTTHSLPSIFQATPESVPAYPEPLRVMPKFSMKYRRDKQVTPLPVVGLCWSGDETRHGGRKVHSMSEGQAMRLICKTDHLVHWVNLNFDRKLPEPAMNISFDGLEELAGLIDNLDYVVSVDSAPAFLAYAMGRKLAVILSSNVDWKYLEEGESPFFEGATLIRNGTGGGIERAIDKTIDHLMRMYGERTITLVG